MCDVVVMSPSSFHFSSFKISVGGNPSTAASTTAVLERVKVFCFYVKAAVASGHCLMWHRSPALMIWSLQDCHCLSEPDSEDWLFDA